jgi:ferritin
MNDLDVDIDAIMNSITDEEKEETLEVDTAGLSKDETMDELLDDFVEDKEEETSLDTVDLDDENALSNRIVQNSLGVIDKAKLVFDNFSADVFHGADKSTSSKEALLKSLDVQNAANKNMIDLAKVLSSKGDKNGTNILINTVSEKQAGISLSNIKDSV